jgi:molybdopterin-containing oxidoreductase family iron-sulfur binding subunit
VYAAGPSIDLQRQRVYVRALQLVELAELDDELRDLVSRLRASSLHYAMLSELNTKPRTTYLARIRNPHPELA